MASITNYFILLFDDNLKIFQYTHLCWNKPCLLKYLTHGKSIRMLFANFITNLKKFNEIFLFFKIGLLINQFIFFKNSSNLIFFKNHYISKIPLYFWIYNLILIYTFYNYFCDLQIISNLTDLYSLINSV